MEKTLYSERGKVLLTLLREVRLAKGVSQVDLASRLDLEQTHISRIERGGRRLDVLELRSWLKALNCDPLAFHAELETRLARSAAGKSETESDPVPSSARKGRKA